MELSREDFPALFRVADESSVVAQRKYLRLVKINLGALILGAVLTSFEFPDVLWRKGLYLGGAAMLAIALFATFLIAQKSYKERWYRGRTVAESVKTYTWRYMMRAEPFVSSLEASDEAFLASLRHIMSGQELTLAGDASAASGSQLTVKMHAVRSRPLNERKEVYLDERIGDQRAWYSGKAAENSRKGERLFITVGLTQLCALLAAVWLAAAPSFGLNMVGILSTLSASVLAWLHVKRHEDLSQSYLVAAQELGIIAAQGNKVEEDERFSRFVADAEAAISREHTLWLARRDSLAGRQILERFTGGQA